MQGCNRLHTEGRPLARVPLRLRGEQVGWLVCCSTDTNSSLLGAAAYALEQGLRLESEVMDLSVEVVRVYEEQASLYAFTSKLGGAIDLDTICTRILEDVDAILGVQNAAIMLCGKSDGLLSTRFSRGRDQETALRFRAGITDGWLGEILAREDPATICDITGRPDLSFPYPVRSLLCVPLVTDGRGIGILVASDKLNGEEFWSHELKFMRVLASEAAAAIKKAQLYEEINELFMNTVDALASAIDAKDPYTYGHSRRVARLSVLIGEKLGMSRSETRDLELAATLHDIGKIGTPEVILRKPGRLTPDEMDRIRQHPEQGAHILANIAEFRELATWIRHHHEWFNGEGYPDRVAASDIPLQARILTIADTFDAMTSDRPYRKGMPAAEAVRIMEEFAGSQLDPVILGVFREIYTRGELGTISRLWSLGDAPG